ncbi:amidase signature enzyme [Tothia fuscella]|uniref:Amidase signature enzyme n=1 Tax=Tothia fuscella TaxID=1048955 RepID=A0A9P4NZM8_9PEZI|nr:amidase signature enzyme [Tothia fuscella]
MAIDYFDPITATAAQLQQLLERREITSVQIVTQYLAQVEKHNNQGVKLNAVLSLVPTVELLAIAVDLDRERLNGITRSPLHGIPIMLKKDNIMTGTDLEVPTTVGSHAFANARAKRAAPFVAQLIESGLIILGKTNLTEFCGLNKKNSGMMPGWSSYGGQTQSAYVKGGLEDGELMLGHSAPGGSSSGSAVSVAAGFCPLAIGTDTAGSVVTPSNRAALYALKFAIGSFPMDGIFALSRTFDSIGVMAKSAEDLQLFAKTVRSLGFNEAAAAELRVGFADPVVWSMDASLCRKLPDADEEMRLSYKDAIMKLQEAGVDIQSSVPVPSPSTLNCGEKSVIQYIASHEFKHAYADFVSHYEQSTCPITSVADMVDWNEIHSELALPAGFSNQADLIRARDNDSSPEDVARAIPEARKLAAEHGIDAVLDQHNIDLIAAPEDSSMCLFASVAGYPLVMVPLGTIDYNGRPHGICIIAKKGQEEKLLFFASAYEKVFPERPLPLQLL